MVIQSRRLAGSVLVALGLIAGMLTLPADRAQGACSSLTTISGTAQGQDFRYLHLFLGISLLDSSGNKVGADGCPAGGSYQITQHVNINLGAEGTNSSAGNTKNFVVTVPTNATNIVIEAYPKEPTTFGPTSHARYGNVRIEDTFAGASGIDIRAPLNCGLSDNGVVGRNGQITVALTEDGVPIDSERASAFSIEESAFPRGFGVAPAVNPNPGQPEVIDSLAAGQLYRMFYKEYAGAPTETFDIDVPPCGNALWTRVIGKFQDVPWGHTFYDDIYWMLDSDLSGGYLDDTFRPNDEVTRQAFAQWLWIQSSSPAADPHPFTDVPPSHPFYDPIAWMYESGNSLGFADATYRPLLCVTRQTVAAFLYRDAGSPPPPFDDPGFSDVPPGYSYETEIAWIVDAGYANGYADNTFRPGDCVSRQHASALLYRYYV